MVGPDFKEPQIDLATHYAFAQSAEIQEASFERWWETFNDPVLNSIMLKGLERNLDIRTAQEEIREAQALYRAAGGAAAQLSGTTSVNSTRTIQNGNLLSQTERGTLQATYVFDLFGGAARGREQAQATLDAETFDVATVRLAYQSELVGAYIDARYFQTALAITRRSIANRQQTLDLVSERLRADDATVLESARAEAELSLAKANLPEFQIGYESNAVRLAALTGLPTVEITRLLGSKSAGIPAPHKAFTPGVPANLLRNRPDILAAERRLAASMAAVGVREAALYPSLSLGGTVTIDADNTLQVGPAITIPILNRPSLLANRDAAVSRARQAELSWQATVRGAIAEVEQALTRVRNRGNEINSLDRATRNYTRLTRLSRDAFELGASTLIELLDAEQTVTSTSNSLAQARRSYAIAMAELAIATGRGSRVGEERPVETVGQ